MPAPASPGGRRAAAESAEARAAFPARPGVPAPSAVPLLPVVSTDSTRPHSQAAPESEALRAGETLPETLASGRCLGAAVAPRGAGLLPPSPVLRA